MEDLTKIIEEPHIITGVKENDTIDIEYYLNVVDNDVHFLKFEFGETTAIKLNNSNISSDALMNLNSFANSYALPDEHIRNQNAELDNKLKKCNEEREQLNVNLTDLQNNIYELNVYNTNIKQNIDELNAEILKLENVIKNLKAEEIKMKDELNNLMTQLKYKPNNEESIKTLKNEIDTLTENIAQKEKLISEINTNLEKNKTEQEKIINKSEENETQMKKTIDELQIKYNVAELKIAEQTKVIAEKEVEIAEQTKNASKVIENLDQKQFNTIVAPPKPTPNIKIKITNENITESFNDKLYKIIESIKSFDKNEQIIANAEHSKYSGGANLNYEKHIRQYGGANLFPDNKDAIISTHMHKYLSLLFFVSNKIIRSQIVLLFISTEKSPEIDKYIYSTIKQSKGEISERLIEIYKNFGDNYVYIEFEQTEFVDTDSLNPEAKKIIDKIQTHTNTNKLNTIRIRIDILSYYLIKLFKTYKDVRSKNNSNAWLSIFNIVLKLTDKLMEIIINMTTNIEISSNADGDQTIASLYNDKSVIYFVSHLLTDILTEYQIENSKILTYIKFRVDDSDLPGSINPRFKIIDPDSLHNATLDDFKYNTVDTGRSNLKNELDYRRKRLEIQYNDSDIMTHEIKKKPNSQIQNEPVKDYESNNAVSNTQRDAQINYVLENAKNNKKNTERDAQIKAEQDELAKQKEKEQLAKQNKEREQKEQLAKQKEKEQLAKQNKEQERKQEEQLAIKIKELLKINDYLKKIFDNTNIIKIFRGKSDKKIFNKSDFSILKTNYYNEISLQYSNSSTRSFDDMNATTFLNNMNKIYGKYEKIKSNIENVDDKKAIEEIEEKIEEKIKKEIEKTIRRGGAIYSEDSISNMYDDSTFENPSFNISNKMVGGGVYNLHSSIGPVNGVFTGEYINNDIVENKTFQRDFFKSLKTNNGNLVVNGIGQSGSGKTSTLIELKLRNGEGKLTKTEPGILKLLITKLAKDSDFGLTHCTFKITELYYDKSKVQQINAKYNELSEYKVLFGNGSFVVTNTKVNGTGKLENKGEMFELIMNFMDNERMTYGTPNNPESSRSHVIITITLYWKNAGTENKSTLTICDLAGVENVFDCTDPFPFLEYPNSEIDKQNQNKAKSRKFNRSFIISKIAEEYLKTYKKQNATAIQGFLNNLNIIMTGNLISTHDNKMLLVDGHTRDILKEIQEKEKEKEDEDENSYLLKTITEAESLVINKWELNIFTELNSLKNALLKNALLKNTTSNINSNETQFFIEYAIETAIKREYRLFDNNNTSISSEFHDLINEFCRERAKEGKYINDTLYKLKEDIGWVMATDGITYSPFIGNCIQVQCNPYVKKCFGDDPYQIVEKEQHNVGDIFINICKNVNITIQINTPPANLKFCIFCVINLSKNANNPPPVPYINISQLIKYSELYNSSIDFDYSIFRYLNEKTQENTEDTTVKETNAKYYIKNIDYFFSPTPVIIKTTLNDIMKKSSFNALNNSTKQIISNKIREIINNFDTNLVAVNIPILLTELIEMINKSNSTTLMGTLEFVDLTAKMGRGLNPCVITANDENSYNLKKSENSVAVINQNVQKDKYESNLTKLNKEKTYYETKIKSVNEVFNVKKVYKYIHDIFLKKFVIHKYLIKLNEYFKIKLNYSEDKVPKIGKNIEKIAIFDTKEDLGTPIKDGDTDNSCIYLCTTGDNTLYRNPYILISQQKLIKLLQIVVKTNTHTNLKHDFVCKKQIVTEIQIDYSALSSKSNNENIDYYTSEYASKIIENAFNIQIYYEFRVLKYFFYKYLYDEKINGLKTFDDLIRELQQFLLIGEDLTNFFNNNLVWRIVKPIIHNVCENKGNVLKISENENLSNELLNDDTTYRIEYDTSNSKFYPSPSLYKIFNEIAVTLEVFKTSNYAREIENTTPMYYPLALSKGGKKNKTVRRYRQLEK